MGHSGAWLGLGEATLVLEIFWPSRRYFHDARDCVRTTLTLVEPPEDEPLTVEEVRDDHLRTSNGSAENAYIDRLIRATRREGERLTRRAWMPQTWTQALDWFPAVIHLQRPPLIEVESIVYIDGDGVAQTLASTEYKVSPAGDGNRLSRITPAYGKCWPVTRSETDAVTVRCRCGYVDGGSPEAAAVPEDLTHGQLLMIGELYKQRSESVNAFQQLPAMIRARDLWQRYRVAF